MHMLDTMANEVRHMQDVDIKLREFTERSPWDERTRAVTEKDRADQSGHIDRALQPFT